MLHTPFYILHVVFIYYIPHIYCLLYGMFSSEEWKRVPNSEKKRMGFTVEDDGEFWYI